MKKLIILFLLFSLNAFGWKVLDGGDQKLCGEAGSYHISDSFWSSSIWDISNFPNSLVEITNSFGFKNEGASFIKNAIKNAVNYWNEAGSEHHFYASDTYDDDTPIGIVYCDTCSWSGLTTGDSYTGVGSGYCGEDEEKQIQINANAFGNGVYSVKFFEVITHEVGHILGLDETNEPYLEAGLDNATYIMMNTDYYRTHITEDDKYGLRDLYGKDDRSIKYAFASYTGNTMNLSETQTLGSGAAFETFAKPQIIPLPGSHYYDYMFVWVKSGDRKIYYSFAKHISGDTSFISVSTPVLLSGSYEILTSPSIAINDNGTEVLFVFQQISENTTIENQEYLYFSKLNLTTNTFTTPTQITTEGIHTNSVPTVIWNEKTGRWIIFWVNRDRTNWMSNWTVKYLVSNNASPSLSSHWNHDKINDFTTTQNETIYTTWNEMSGDCQKEYYSNNVTKDRCYLLLNRIYSGSVNSSTVNKLMFETDTTDSPYRLKITNTSDLNLAITNFGHISSLRIGSEIYLTILNGTYQPKPKSYKLDNYSLNNFNTVTSLPTTGNTTDSTISLTGHSIAKTSSNPVVITWIEK